jgi:hypothetical protein
MGRVPGDFSACMYGVYIFLADIHNSCCLNCCFVVVFFTLTDRASTIPSNLRGCQSGTWSAGQKEVRGTSIKHTQKRQRERNKDNKIHMPEKRKR